jgi:hypothetical protein
MIHFDPSEPASLHDRLNDTVEPWTGEDAEDYKQHSIAHPDGTIEWHGLIFDGWGCLGDDAQLRRFPPPLWIVNS